MFSVYKDSVLRLYSQLNTFLEEGNTATIYSKQLFKICHYKSERACVLIVADNQQFLLL